MKLSATVVLSFQARTLAEAGAKLDEVLAPAREHADIEIKTVDLQTPSGGPAVTIPQPPGPPRPARAVPHPLPDGGA
jgi:hypothetical protein